MTAGAGGRGTEPPRRRVATGRPGLRRGSSADSSGGSTAGSTVRSTDRFTERARAARRRTRVIVGVAALVLALVVAAVWLVRFSPVLDVRDLRVTGANGTLADEATRAAAAPTGAPLAGVDLTAIGRRVADVPAIEEARVSRQWPHTLVVAVTPRVAVLAVTDGPGGVRLVDRHGVAYATVPKPPSGVPAIAADKTADAAALSGAVSMMAALPADLRSSARDITVAGAHDMRFIVDGVAVRWGDASKPELKAQVLRVLLRTKPRSINVSAPDAPAASGGSVPPSPTG